MLRSKQFMVLLGMILPNIVLGFGGSIPWSDPVLYLKIAGIILVGVTVFVLEFRQFEEHHKKLLFWIMTVSVVLSTLYLAGFIIHKNQASVTKGPVHWHADFQVWLCGERLNLVDPKGWNNKVGSPLFHEHNDDRIHVEGAVMDLADVDLGSFFERVGGKLSRTEIEYPEEDKMHRYKSGDRCLDGSVGTLKVYVNGKLHPNPEHYVLSPEPYVPPGDCIIFLFDNSAGRTTDKICESWVAQGRGY